MRTPPTLAEYRDTTGKHGTPSNPTQPRASAKQEKNSPCTVDTTLQSQQPNRTTGLAAVFPFGQPPARRGAQTLAWPSLANSTNAPGRVRQCGAQPPVDLDLVKKRQRDSSLLGERRKPENLLDDGRHHPCAYRSPALAEGEAKPLVHDDWTDQLKNGGEREQTNRQKRENEGGRRGDAQK